MINNNSRQKEQDRLGAEIDNDFGMTVKEVITEILAEYRKLDWYDEDEKLDVVGLDFFLDEDAPGTFILFLKYMVAGEVVEDSDECYHYYFYDFDFDELDEDEVTDSTKVIISQIEGDMFYNCINPVTKKEGWDAINDIVVDLSHYKKRFEQKKKINKFLR